MKKIMAYLATGILLGVVVMLLPRNLIPRLSSEVSPAGGFDYSRWTANECPDEAYEGLSVTEQSKDIKIDKVGGIGVFPSSLLYAGLISVISLLFALGVYSFSKRRMIT